jgi:hypothetical protein
MDPVMRVWLNAEICIRQGDGLGMDTLDLNMPIIDFFIFSTPCWFARLGFLPKKPLSRMGKFVSRFPVSHPLIMLG